MHLLNQLTAWKLGMLSDGQDTYESHPLKPSWVLEGLSKINFSQLSDVEQQAYLVCERLALEIDS